jgi:hypothetical protein
LLGVDSDSIPKCIGIPAGDYGRNRDVIEVTDSSEKLMHLMPLELQLMLVGDVLVIASATMPKVGAEWFDPSGRNTQHFPQFGPVKAALLLNDLGFHLLVVNCQGNENDLPAGPSDAGTAERDILNPKSNASTWGTIVSKSALWNIFTSPEYYWPRPD